MTERVHGHTPHHRYRRRSEPQLSKQLPPLPWPEKTRPSDPNKRLSAPAVLVATSVATPATVRQVTKLPITIPYQSAFKHLHDRKPADVARELLINMSFGKEKTLRKSFTFIEEQVSRENQESIDHARGVSRRARNIGYPMVSLAALGATIFFSYFPLVPGFSAAEIGLGTLLGGGTIVWLVEQTHQNGGISRERAFELVEIAPLSELTGQKGADYEFLKTGKWQEVTQ